MRRLIPAIFIFLVLAATVSAQQFPKPVNYVSDFAGVIDDGWEQSINALAKEVEGNTSSQIFIATVDDTSPYAAKEYATALFNEWKIGQKGKDNGVLVLVAFKPERRVEIETGYGVEGILPDSKSGRIRREYTPLLAAGNYGEGLYNVVKAIGGVIEGSGEFSGSPDIFVDLTGFIIWSGLMVFIFAAIGLGMRKASAKCPDCKIKMEIFKQTVKGDYIITDFVCKKCGKKLQKKKRKNSGGVYIGGMYIGSGGSGGGFGGGGGGGSGGGGSGGGF